MLLSAVDTCVAAQSRGQSQKGVVQPQLSLILNRISSLWPVDTELLPVSKSLSLFQRLPIRALHPISVIF